MSTVTPMFPTLPSSTLDVSYDFAVFASYFEGRAYDDTSAEECAAWLHAADLAHRLAAAVKRLHTMQEERDHSP